MTRGFVNDFLSMSREGQEKSFLTRNQEYMTHEMRRVRGAMNSEHVVQKQLEKRDDKAPCTNRLMLNLSLATLNRYVKPEQIYSEENGPYLVLDMAYDDIMGKREHKNMWKQVAEGFGYNVSRKNPFFCHITGVSEQSEEYSETYLDGKNRFDFKLTDECYTELFPRNRLVYLSPDAPVELKTFDHNAVYIIGGLVDKSQKTRQSFSRAREQGLRMARLPLDRFFR